MIEFSYPTVLIRVLQSLIWVHLERMFYGSEP